MEILHHLMGCHGEWAAVFALLDGMPLLGPWLGAARLRWIAR